MVYTRRETVSADRIKKFKVNLVFDWCHTIMHIFNNYLRGNPF